MECSYKKIFGDKQNVLFVFAHPDDTEIYAGGLVARLNEDGKHVHLVKMTMGNKGSRGMDVSETELAQIRQKEDTHALTVLGLTYSHSENLNLGDGCVKNSLRVIEKLVRVIRTHKPDLIVTHNPHDVFIRDLDGYYYANHRDHRNTGLSVVDAVYPYSRDRLFYPEHLQDGLDPHTVTEFLFVDSWGSSDSVYFDVTETAEARKNAIYAHASQFNPEKSESLMNYFAPEKDGRRYEQFRHIVID